MSLNAGDTFPVQFSINETDLLAGTAQELVSPVNGYITALGVVVQKAVTTGGDITVEKGASPAAVTGLSVTVADAATAGTTYADTATTGTATRQVSKGERFRIVPSAAFATAGAVNGYVVINTADVSPALPAA